MKTKTFAQIHEQEERLNGYAMTGTRHLKVWAIATRYKDAYLTRFGFDVCSKPELYNTPLTRAEYAGF